MARGLLYTARFDSDKYGNYNRIEIWEEGFTGVLTAKALGGAPLLKKDSGDSGIYGTSLELSLQANLNSELVKLYTSDNKKFLVKLYRNDFLYWQGFVLPEKYSEPSVTPPYDVSVTATDGLGVLKNLDLTLTGRHTILSVLKYCLDKTGLNLDFEIICDLQETTQDFTRSVLAQVTTDTGQWKEKSCYEVLGEICSSLRMFITEYRGMWRVARFSDLKSDSMIYSNTLVYQGIISNSIYNLGNISEVVYPIGSLTRDILPAYKSCKFTRTFVKRDSFFNNSTFNLLEGWTTVGNVETEYDNGVHYAVLEGTADGQSLSQIIAVEKSDRAFVFQISYLHKYQAPYKFFINLSLSAGTTIYYLTPAGWSTSPGEKFQFDVDITNVVYNEDDTVRSYYRINGSIDKTTQETGEISFEGLPIDGNLTIEISFTGPETMPNGHRRGKLYITGANFITETPKGLEVKTLLSSASEAATDTEIFFGDTETADNSDQQMFNNLKFTDSRYTVFWKIGPESTQSTFFNTIIKDYVCTLGLAKESLSGTLQSAYLDIVTILHENFTGINFFIDTFTHNLLTDEMEVSLTELIPYLEIASIATAEVDETNPEIIIDYVRGEDGVLHKTYTIASIGTSYTRGTGYSLQDLSNSAVSGLNKISNFAKALAALAQQRADAANIKALTAAEGSSDALLRLNNIVSNNIISQEEKAGLKELLLRLSAEINLYQNSTTNFGADLTALTTSYNSLNTFLTNIVLLNVDEGTELTDEQVTTYNSLFADFYAKRSVFTTEISKIRAELINFKNRAVLVQEDYNKVSSQYSNVYSDSALTGIYKTNIEIAKTNFDTAFNNYHNYLNSIISDGIITITERNQAETLQTAYTAALYSFDYNVQAAKKAITDNMSKTLSDISSDNVLVPFEKRIALKEWQTIQGERNTIVSQAGTYAVSTANYISAYDSLDTYITPLLVDMMINSDITGDTFRATFKAYYDDKALLLKSITDAAEGADAISYKVNPSVNVIKVSKTGVITPTAITCEKIKQTGASAPAVTTEKILKYQVSGGSETAYTEALTPLTTWLYVDFVLYDSDGTTILDKERVPVVADGKDGVSGTSLVLTTNHQVFLYDAAGNLAESGTWWIYTTVYNSPAGTLYYELIKDGESVQNTTSSTFGITPAATYSGMPDKYEVIVRLNSTTGTEVARDMITLFGVKPGATGATGSDGKDAYTVILTNETHALPASSAGVVSSYLNSGTDIMVWLGVNQVPYGTGAGTFDVSVSATGITVGSASIVSTYTRRFADHSAMTADNASIAYTIRARNAAGTEVTMVRTQTFTKANAGVDGTAGYEYLAEAIKDGSTIVNGGVILSNMLMLRNIAGSIISGMSGISGDNVFLFADNSNAYQKALQNKAMFILKKDGTANIGIFKIDRHMVGVYPMLFDSSGDFLGLDLTKEIMRFQDTAIPALGTFLAIIDITINYAGGERTYSGQESSNFGYSSQISTSAAFNLTVTAQLTAQVTNNVENLTSSAFISLDLYKIIDGVYTYDRQIDFLSVSRDIEGNDIQSKDVNTTFGLDAGIYVILVRYNIETYSNNEGYVSVYGATMHATGASANECMIFGTNGFVRIKDGYNYAYMTDTETAFSHGAGKSLKLSSTDTDFLKITGPVNMPGILGSATSSSAGALTNVLGNVKSVTKDATGVYTITHNLGFSSYTAMITPVNSSGKINAVITSRGTSSFSIRIADASNNTATDSVFDILIIGNNV